MSPGSPVSNQELPAALLLKGGNVVTMDESNTVLSADVRIRGTRIDAIGPDLVVTASDDVLDVSGCLILPGFVQTHVHLCQSLWRNHADDMDLMDWLRLRTWPLEAAHDPDTLAAAARLACAELLLGGTTTINDMGTVHHTEALVRAAAATGIRGIYSKVLMDLHDGPDALRQDPDEAVAEAIDLASTLPRESDRVGFALAPRFAVSSSIRLLENVARASVLHALPVHTHASENDDENRLTLERFGERPISLYRRLGMLGPRLLLAHCVRIDASEINELASAGTSVLHCPTANLKLGSGIAPVQDMIRAGIRVTLGSDGPPCNNNLDMFREMRAAALIQKGLHGALAMPAWQVLRMATIEGARALGLDADIGTVEVGKKADLSVLDPRRAHSMPVNSRDPASSILYSMDRDNIRHVIVDGRLHVREGVLLSINLSEVLGEAQEAAKRLFAQAGIRAGYSGPGS
jgi:cytosine/adenosine deaminase-related metal-dependent hydrolase